MAPSHPFESRPRRRPQSARFSVQRACVWAGLNAAFIATDWPIVIYVRWCPGFLFLWEVQRGESRESSEACTNFQWGWKREAAHLQRTELRFGFILGLRSPWLLKSLSDWGKTKEWKCCSKRQVYHTENNKTICHDLPRWFIWVFLSATILLSS